MNSFAQFVLISCIPLVLVIFAMMPPRRAVITMTVFSWLFMPNSGFAIPGLPDYTKSSATTIGCLMGVLLYDTSRIFRFRPRWYDLPVFIWCVGNVATSVSNDIGLYDGLSQTLKSIILWGLPYFLGRIYMNDPEGCRECAMGIILGGLAYVPLCLWEVRMSPTIQATIYGTAVPFEPPRFHLGYRPSVFMVSGLEVGMWMTAASLCAYWLWRSRAVKEIMGISFGWLVVALIITTLLTKAVGANLLMFFGLTVLELVRRTKASWIVLILVFAPPTYTAVRTTGLWSGREIVNWTQVLIPGRESSVDLRIVSEDHLIARALERPLFGWGGFNRNRIIVNGRDMYPTDGYWVITLGIQGVVGLVAMITALALPLWLTYRRFPARLWSEPLIAPIVSLSMLLGLYSMDCLANAMVNPMYAIILGGVTGLSAADGLRSRRAGAMLLALADSHKQAGRMEAAEKLYREALGFDDTAGDGPQDNPHAADEAAYVQESLAEILLADGSNRVDEARHLLACAVKARVSTAALTPNDLAALDRLAGTLGNLGRVLAAQGHDRDADWAWSRALEVRTTVATALPDAEDARRRLADSRNDLAWYLATHHDARPDAADDAVRLGREAVELFPEDPGYWNTLGGSCYYAGDPKSAVESLARAAELAGGGTAFDYYLMSMSYFRMGAHEQARECFQWAEAWTRENQPDHAELARLRHEASELIDA